MTEEEMEAIVQDPLVLFPEIAHLKDKDLSELSREEREKYDPYIRMYRDWLVTLDFAKQKGEAKGFMRGLTEARAEGRAEGKLDVARRMKAMSIPAETISLCTGLSLDEIAGL